MRPRHLVVLRGLNSSRIVAEPIGFKVDSPPFARRARLRGISVMLVTFAVVTVGLRGLIDWSGVDASVMAELDLANSTRPGLRVLFIGNSFTYENSLIAMVTRLAAEEPAAPRAIVAVEYAPGGSTLQEAGDNPQLRRLLMGARWNVVVLQEQSQLPELQSYLTSESLPAVTKLQEMIGVWVFWRDLGGCWDDAEGVA